MTTNDYQWIPITTNDYQRLSERYQKDYLKRSIDIRWLFNPLLSLILRLSCFEKLTPLEPFSTPMILLLSFYGNISKKNSPCMSSFKGCSSVKQLFAKVWFMFMIVTWRKDSLTSSTWFIHVESMYICCKISTLWNCVVSWKKVGSCRQEWKRVRFTHDNIFLWIFTVWSIKPMMLQNQELILSFKWKLKNSFQGELGRRRDI